jgi:beta-glucuronidase
MTNNAQTQRVSQTLTQGWRFQLDQDNRGELEEWFAAENDRSSWAEVAVPGAWDLYQPALWSYEGVAWYAVTIPAEWVLEDRWQRLIFQRVNYHAKVWLNGVLVGEHLNGYLPFEVAASPQLRHDGPNTLVLRVDNAQRDEWLPGSRTIEWVQYGGILQPVRLETTSHVYLSDLAINAQPVGEGAQVRCVVEVTNESPADFHGQVTLHIQEQVARGAVTCSSCSTQTLTLTLNLARAEKWSLEAPVLYTACASLTRDEQVIDQMSETFGVRTIETRGRQVLLNGKPLRLHGVCRYDEYAGYGPALPEDVLRADLLSIKQAGVNLIRTHYPQPPLMLRLMDEIGLLLMEEVPLNWWGQNWWGAPPDNAGPVIAAAEQALIGMLRRDKNHPCVVIWSMCNECATDNPVGIAAMRRLISLARRLDDTRLITFVVAGDVRKHQAFDAADMVCTNLYFGLFSEDMAHHVADMPVRVTQTTREHLLTVKDTFGDKPLLITEFGCHGIQGLHGDVRFSEDYQAAYIQAAWLAFIAVPEVVGGVLWCWADYYHRRGFFGTGGSMYQAPFGPYGAVTVDRRPKRALAQLAQLFAADH